MKDVEARLQRLRDVSVLQLDAVRKGELDTLETLETERRSLMEILGQDELAELASREPDLVGECLRVIVENDRLARMGLKQSLERLETELGRTDTQQRAEKAYLKMASRS